MEKSGVGVDITEIGYKHEFIWNGTCLKNLKQVLAHLALLLV